MTRAGRKNRGGTREGAASGEASPGVAARQAAVSALHNILVLGLHAGHGAAEALPPRDRALAHALLQAALRRLPALDALIDSSMTRPLPPDARARHVLRIALAGHFCLETPAYAVVATALPLVRGGPRRLVHGVLSRLLREERPLPPSGLPGVWEERLGAMWGPDAADAAVRLFHAIPPVDLALRDPDGGRGQRLDGESHMEGHLRLAGTERVEDIPGYADGAWWVQDLAAQIPVHLLGDVRGKRVLDLCAAPGGKTMQLAARGAAVAALDISAARVRRLQQNLRRTGLSAEIAIGNALTATFAEPFDAILLDAPCSATGTFRRHPDVLYLKDEKAAPALKALQSSLLERAARWLKPGGVLVYAVCSLDRGEQATSVTGLVPDSISRDELPDWVVLSGNLAATPPSALMPAGGADGFQMARFRRPD